MEYMIYLCLPLDKVYPKIYITRQMTMPYDITLTMENPKVIKMLNFLKNIFQMKNCLSILCLKL